MAKDGIRIPVSVEGADEAKREVDALAQSLGAADTQQVAGKGQVAQATRQAASAQEAFNNSAKTALTSVLSRINPQLGAMASTAINVAKGIGQASTALLGMVGLGAALGGIAMLFSHMAQRAQQAAEAVERMQRAREQAARESLSMQQRVAGELERAGVLGRGREATRTAEELQRGGLPEDLAIAGAVMQQVGGLRDEQLDQALGAFLLGGRRAPMTAGGIAALMKVPRAQAVAALRAKIADVGVGAMAEAPMFGTSQEQREEEAAAQRMRAAGFSEKEVAAALAGLRGQPIEPFLERYKLLGAPPGPGAVPEHSREYTEAYLYRQRALSRFAPAGSNRPIERLVSELRAQLEAVRGVGPDQPVQVTINNNWNVGEMWTLPPGLRELHQGVDAAELRMSVE